MNRVDKFDKAIEFLQEKQRSLKCAHMLKRLTDKHWRNFDPWEMCGLDDDCKRTCVQSGEWCKIALKLRRLAEYEDTGLTPAEVAELAQAKADGRVVVLPCKRGDMVYFIGINYTKCSAYGTEYDEVCCAGCEEPCDSEKTRNVYMTQAEDTRWILRRLNDFGRIYFLTREEAEKALKECEK